MDIYHKLLIFHVFFFILIISIKTDDIYIDSISGNDSTTCGALESPCKTVYYTVENKVENNDMVILTSGQIFPIFNQTIEIINKNVSFKTSDESDNLKTILDFRKTCGQPEKEGLGPFYFKSNDKSYHLVDFQDITFYNGVCSSNKSVLFSESNKESPEDASVMSMTFLRCNFENTTASSLDVDTTYMIRSVGNYIHFQDEYEGPKVIVDNSNFYNNGMGSIVVIGGDEVEIIDSTFENSSTDYNPAVSVDLYVLDNNDLGNEFDNYKINIVGSTFTDNGSLLLLGSALSITSAFINPDSSSNGQYKGEPIPAFYPSVLIDNCNFNSNQAPTLYFFQIPVKITNSGFSDNYFNAADAVYGKITWINQYATDIRLVCPNPNSSNNKNNIYLINPITITKTYFSDSKIVTSSSFDQKTERNSFLTLNSDDDKKQYSNLTLVSLCSPTGTIDSTLFKDNEHISLLLISPFDFNVRNCSFDKNSNTGMVVSSYYNKTSMGDNFNQNNFLNIDSVEFVNNQLSNDNSDNNGGAIFIFPQADDNVLNPLPIVVNISSSNIKNNKAHNGGGIYVSKSTLNIADTKIENNECTSRGGGIYCDNSTITDYNDNVNVHDNTKKKGDDDNIYCKSCSLVNLSCKNPSSSSSGSLLALHITEAVLLILTGLFLMLVIIGIMLYMRYKKRMEYSTLGDDDLILNEEQDNDYL